MASIEEPRYKGVEVSNPRIQDFLKNCKKIGVEKEKAMKLSGMPMEVVDKAYREDVKK